MEWLCVTCFIVSYDIVLQGLSSLNGITKGYLKWEAWYAYMEWLCITCLIVSYDIVQGIIELEWHHKRLSQMGGMVFGIDLAEAFQYHHILTLLNC
jgi:hypothetical protein